ncbi:hypothetical protein TNCV_3211801 [Trichonephila clavipes]|uniref:Uncharacterized protein n=1 Tax=Trichonephila clavipes TaxID=2585209 RepID=A0A8X6SAN5_TRICX|nr:hypothetical protein TNCV_3211801 [Trichonephila clavipes]
MGFCYSDEVLQALEEVYDLGISELSENIRAGLGVWLLRCLGGGGDRLWLYGFTGGFNLVQADLPGHK